MPIGTLGRTSVRSPDPALLLMPKWMRELFTPLTPPLHKVGLKEEGSEGRRLGERHKEGVPVAGAGDGGEMSCEAASSVLNPDKSHRDEG